MWPTPGEGKGVLGQASGSSNSLLVVLEDAVAVFEVGEQNDAVLGGGSVKVTGAGGNGFTVRCSMWHLKAMLHYPGLSSLTNIVWVGGKLIAACLTTPCVVVLEDKDGKAAMRGTNLAHCCQEKWSCCSTGRWHSP